MAEMNLAQLIRLRTEKAIENDLDYEVQRQWKEVMDLVNEAALRGQTYVTWKKFVRYYEGQGTAFHACLRVRSKLKSEGFRIGEQGCAIHGLGIGW